jgi:periplasmic copper chaperone A
MGHFTPAAAAIAGTQVGLASRVARMSGTLRTCLNPRRFTRMGAWSTVLITSIGVIACGAGAVAHEIKHEALTIVHPWVLETEKPTTDLHVKIKNSGKVAERLLRASTRVATAVLLVGVNGQGVSDVVIPSRGELTLQPGGAHIVLSGLAKPLRPYDSFDLTLVFEKAGAVQVEVMVEEDLSDKPGAG